MEQEKLNKILNDHKLWLYGKGGRGANLRYADLRGANLIGADLRGANLRYADLSGANLIDADLIGANLIGVNLRGANLRGVNLRGANLIDANLRGANLRGAKGITMACPEEGSFIGFKKCQGNKIVKLEILSDAKRSSATGRKCRCDKAKVLSITNIDGLQEFAEAISNYDSLFTYKVDSIVSIDNFNENRWEECASGIHFFITRQEAVEY